MKFNNSKVRLLYLTILLFTIGCSSPKLPNNAKETINIDVSKVSSLIDFIDIIDSVEIIPLKSIEATGIRSIVADGSHYYALNSRDQILKFDSKGNQMLVIDRRGRAGNEYLSIANLMMVDDKLRIYSYEDPRIMDYSKVDGSFLGKKKLDGLFFNAFSNNNITVAYNSSGEISEQQPNMLTVFDSSANKLAEYMEMPSFLRDIEKEQNMPLTSYKNEILLTRLFSSNIYAINQDTVYLKYCFDFGKQSITDDYVSNISMENPGDLISHIMKAGYVNGIDYFFETDSYLYFVYLYEGEAYSVYYNKKTNKTLLLKSNLVWGSCHIAKDNQGRFISTLFTTVINDKMRNDFKQQNNEISDRIVSMLDDNKNEYEYCILLYKLK